MMFRGNDKKLNKLIGYLLLPLMCIALIIPAVRTADADAVTDELTVKVGYSGMELSDYVEVDTFHWRELSGELPIHKVAYSYFRSEGKKKYTAIVDSAQGFYISDLLDLCNIYYGDVKSLKFYVEDHKGIRTSFDSGALFRSRYYYEDLAGHRTVVYGTKIIEREVTETIHHDAEYETRPYTETIHHDAEYKTETYTEVIDGEEVEKEREVLVKEAWDEEVEKEEQVLVTEAWDEEVTKTVTEEVEDKSKIVEYKFDKAGRYATQVQPMLAIEDNWAQFNEEFEHIGPDFTSMNAGNRFRLLFGQTTPTESMTSMSDKYVSCVYVVLDGNPTIGEMGGLSGSYGSHTVDMTVSSDNINIRDALSELMTIDSTNKDVLVITGVRVTPDPNYSDLAKVTVSYDIVGEGEASITAGIGSAPEPIMTSEVIKAGKKPEDGSSDEGSNGSGSVDNENTSDASNTKNNSPGKKTKGNGTIDKKTDNDNKNSDKKEIKTAEKTESQKSRSTATYSLSDAASENIDRAVTSQTMTAALKDEEIKEVLIEDKTEEKEERRRTILVLTGLFGIVLAAAGGVAELMSFNIRLRGTRRRSLRRN